MRPLAFDLRDSKKIAADPHSSTFQMKGGHTLRIAHAPLSAIHRKMIEKMPVVQKLAEGDASVQADPENSEAFNPLGIKGDDSDNSIPGIGGGAGTDLGSLPQSSPTEAPGTIGGIALNDPNAIPEQSEAPSKDDLPAPSTSLPDQGKPVGGASTGNNFGSQSFPGLPNVSLGGAYDLGIKGIEATQQAQSALAQSRVDADKLYQTHVVAENAQWEDERQAKMMEIQNATDDVQNGTINPNHYLENLSVPGKIATAIGMIFSGVGSGVTGRSPAMDWINGQIGRDIDAQKANQENRKTVLGAYQQKYQNAVVAEKMARATQYNIYASQLQKAADQATTPLAAAQALTAKSQLQQQILPLVNQANIIQRLHQGSGAGLDALDLGRAGLIPPEQATKEQTSVNTANARVQQANRLFDELDQEQTPSGLVNPQSYARRNQIMAQMTPLVQDEDPAKRLTEETYQKEIAPFIYSTGATASTRQAARAGLTNLIRTATEGGHPNVSKYLPNSLLYNQQSQQAQTGQAQHRVGDILYHNGQKIQVIDAKGNYRAVR